MKYNELPIAIIVNDLIITEQGLCIDIAPSTGVNTAKSLLSMLVKTNYTVFKFDENYNIELTINQRDRINNMLLHLSDLNYIGA